MGVETKIYGKCGLDKPVTEFRLRKLYPGHKKRYYHSYCRACAAVLSAEYCKVHPEKCRIYK